MKKNNIRHFLIRSSLLTILLFNGFSNMNVSILAQTKSDDDEIHLSFNENPFKISDNVRESIINEIENINRYAGGKGADFVDFVAIHEGVEPDQIIVGEILDLLGVYIALKNREASEFIHSVPGYPVFANAAAIAGGRTIEVPLNDSLEVDLATIEAHVTDKTAAIFLINPHNPSGTVIENDTLHDFISRVSKKVLIVIDEAYLEYANNFAERTALNNLKAGDNVIVYRTLAKAYALGGLTIGYAIAPLELAKYLKSNGLGETHALNRLSIAAARASLADGAKVAKESQIVKEEREKWHVILDELGLKYSRSKANFVFIDTQRPASEIKQLFRDRAIEIGPLYDTYPTWIRITIGRPEENIIVQTILLEIINQNNSDNK